MLTADQIVALAPDAGSAKAAQGLLGPAKWSALGGHEGALWGACQGSGSTPYVVGIDLSGPAFTCSCPSRKFPCKHGLALFLLRAARGDLFGAAEAPERVAQWLAGRQSRAEKQAEKVAEKQAAKAAPPAGESEGVGEAAAPVEGSAPAGEAAADPTRKREARRLERMQAGARDLSVWLADRVRQGLAVLPGAEASLWETAAARLVDAQAPGLASRLRELGAVVHSGAGWPERTLVYLGQLQLLADALARFEALPPPVQADVRGACGWPLDRDSAEADAQTDRWWVRGVAHEEGDRLFERRVWLHGQTSGRVALLLDFAFGGPRFDVPFVPGTCVQATLGFFPSRSPLRALLLGPPVLLGADEAAAEPTGAEPTGAIGALGSAPGDAPHWSAALDLAAARWAGNPWATRLPVALAAVTPVHREGAWWAHDGQGAAAPLVAEERDAWGLLAVSGGAPVCLFGEWSAGRLRPLAAWAEDAASAPIRSLPAPLWVAERGF